MLNNRHFFLISNFRHVLNVVCFLLCNSAASEFYMPTFRNTLFHLHRQVRAFIIFKKVNINTNNCINLVNAVLVSYDFL